MHRDRDFDPEADLPPHEAALTQDLELNTLLHAMAGGDKFLLGVAKRAVLVSLTEPDAILYRQEVVRDCLENPAVVREIYAIALEAIEREKRAHHFWREYPDGLLNESTEVLSLFVGLLRKLRQIAEGHQAEFRSEGFTRFFGMLISELDDSYLSVVEGHLRRLEFPDGVLMSAALGTGNKGIQYVLRRPWNRKRGWKDRLLLRGDVGFDYQVADRDESGMRALAELRGRGIGLVAIALAQSTDHILSFFRMLRSELGFCIGSLNLRERLAEKDEAVCFPEPLPAGDAALRGRGLYDACLSLNVGGRVVGNDLNADNRPLVLITGANRGGKSTFLRAIGVAQLMMQCGMFVPAESYRASVCEKIFTHFKREEDAEMRSGKLDEELGRMSSIVDSIGRDSMVLFNESFASTNEREGSEIARQVVRALLDAGIRVVYVTHLFDLAHSFFDQDTARGLFLRAERQSDGQRTFRLVEGEPLPTSFGEDVYHQVFGAGAHAAAAAATATASGLLLGG